MPRQPRRTPADTVFHAIDRGVGWRSIFHKPQDYDAFELILAAAEEFDLDSSLRRGFQNEIRMEWNDQDRANRRSVKVALWWILGVLVAMFILGTQGAIR